MEKRSYPRTEIHLQATFLTSGNSAQACEITDYSQIGMQVHYIKGSKVRLESGEHVTLDFALDEEGGRRNYRLRGEVAHTDDESAGVRFGLMENETFHAIHNTVTGGEEGEEHKVITDTDRQAYKDFFVTQSKEHGSRLIKEFFPELSNHLMQCADKANNNTEQRQFFDALQEIETKREVISDRFLQELNTHLNNWLEQRPPINKDQKNKAASNISLIQKGNFEDWLVVKVTATRLQSRFSNLLFELRQRIDTLTDAKLLDKHNPISPTILCQSFAESQRDVVLEAQGKQIVFSQFERVANIELGKLYQCLNAHIETEFSPSYTAPEQQDSDTTPLSNDRPEEIAEASYQSKKEDKEVPAENSSQSFIQQHSKGTQSVQQTRSKLGNLQADIQRNREVAEQAYNSVRNLLGMKYSRGAVGSDPNAQYLSNPEAELDMDEVLDIIDDLQHEPIPQMDNESTALTQRIQAQMPTMENGEPMQLRQQDSQSINMVEGLFQHMLSNKSMNHFAQDWMKQLELPIAKVMLQDEDLLQESQHPARQVINQLGRLGMMGAMSNAMQRKNIDNILHNITENYTTDIDVFSDALDQFDGLISQQKKVTQRNADRVAKTCEGEQRVVDAKQRVQKEVDQRIAGKRIPRAFNLLLEDGWKDLLTVTFIRNGDTDSRWLGALNLMDKLLHTFSPKNYGNKQLAAKISPVLKLIKKELDQMSSDIFKHDNIIKELKVAIIACLNEGKEPDSVFIPAKDNLDDNVIPLPNAGMKKWIEKVKTLEKGDWLEIIQEEKDSIQVSLAWISQDQNKFAFVNHQGMKVLDYKLETLAEGMQDGRIIILEQQDTPLVDLGLDNMVQSIYSELTFQATHDETTKLPNRKEFRTRLENAVNDCRKNKQPAVFCLLDIDQFKLINNACGYEGGDKILIDFAASIQNHLGEDILLARLGGNEFGVLFHENTQAEGLVQAKKLKNMIQQTRFSWQERPYNMTASMGLVEINEHFNTATELFEAADSACLSAKEAGRNKIEVYQKKDGEKEQRDIFMDWSTKLTRALDDNQLELMCQEVVPVAGEEQLKPHFEILISVLNGQVPEIPPHEFIHASEHYNRMHMIDRWAISKLMLWMSKNTRRLDEINGFTLKLSGYSINDERLMAFIFDQAATQGIPMGKICFEVTETSAIKNLGDALDFMHEMKKIGCKFSLTDFGTGQSSYTFLRRLPVDFVKIDSSFIQGVANDETDSAVVKSINEIAHFMKKQTIADCVDNSEDLEKLKEIGVDFAQGNAFPAPKTLKSM